MDGIPTYYTNLELPGIPLLWLQADQVTPVPFAANWILKAQLVRGDSVIVEQTTSITGDDISPNWVLERWEAATLTAIAADLVALGCREQLYKLFALARRTADSADDQFDPENPPVIRFKLAPT